MHAFFRGTTPLFTFNLPFDPAYIDTMWLTFKQGQTVFTKGLSDATIGDTSLSVTLTQSETLQFLDDKAVLLQMRVLFQDGTAAASAEKRLDVGRILKGGVISAGSPTY